MIQKTKKIFTGITFPQICPGQQKQGPETKGTKEAKELSPQNINKRNEVWRALIASTMLHFTSSTPHST